ncbi:hypothetical protein D1BOALGB6SA_4796 [Olavius sp. associated proteobacterium Delta 1]|nr:hypothetical protein D1BOALGB6SA_4796 [Olavius sp. associated proteobacterium Delta 1]
MSICGKMFVMESIENGFHSDIEGGFGCQPGFFRYPNLSIS